MSTSPLYATPVARDPAMMRLFADRRRPSTSCAGTNCTGRRCHRCRNVSPEYVFLLLTEAVSALIDNLSRDPRSGVIKTMLDLVEEPELHVWARCVYCSYGRFVASNARKNSSSVILSPGSAAFVDGC